MYYINFHLFALSFIHSVQFYQRNDDDDDGSQQYIAVCVIVCVSTSD